MLKLRFVVVIAVMVAALSGSVATVSAGVSTPTDVVSISPFGMTVGVAHPVTVTFAGRIADRAAAERSLEITSTDTPAGEFSWLNDHVMQWNPTEFWPAHSTIALSVDRTSGETHVRHRITPDGFYRGKKVIEKPATDEGQE